MLGKVSASLKEKAVVIQSVLMLSKKRLMVKWVSDDPFSISMWKFLIYMYMMVKHGVF